MDLGFYQNGFDELKNQWGLSGFTTQDLNRCQTQLYLTPLHGKVSTIKALVANIHAALEHVKTIAEQLPKVDRWATLLRCICQRFAPIITSPRPQTALAGSR